MSESLDRVTEVPELTGDESQSRVLHRDGLMLVIGLLSGMELAKLPRVVGG